MKSDGRITERIARESLTGHDVSYVRKLVLEGMSDQEILKRLRARMVSNSKSLQAYIRQEKVRGLMLKLSFRVHWLLTLPVIEKWLEDKEEVAGWVESKHHTTIDRKARELRRLLLEKDCGRIRREYVCSGRVTDEAIGLIEGVAEELLCELERNGDERQRPDQAALTDADLRKLLGSPHAEELSPSLRETHCSCA